MKKNPAWSAGAMKKMKTASITTSTPVIIGFRKSRMSEAIGTRRAPVRKNGARAKVLMALRRVSSPIGESRYPHTIAMMRRIVRDLEALVHFIADLMLVICKAL